MHCIIKMNLHYGNNFIFPGKQPVISSRPVIAVLLLMIFSLGINPHGLLPAQLWQMDVTHVPYFDKRSYIHVTVDTYSGFLVASSLTGEAAKHVIAHCFHTLSVLGLPLCIKSDNAPAYSLKTFHSFCAAFNISFKTGILYNPQGQGIVE